jgi:hypothetical protein
MGLGGQPFGTSNLEGGGMTLDGDVIGPANDNVIADGVVDNDKLAPEAVTIDKMAANSVGSSQILNNAVDNDKIADGSVTVEKLAVGAITIPSGTPGIPNASDPTSGLVEVIDGVGIMGDGKQAARFVRSAGDSSVVLGSQSDGLDTETIRLATDSKLADLVLDDTTGTLAVTADDMTVNGTSVDQLLNHVPEGSFVGRVLDAGDGEFQFIEQPEVVLADFALSSQNVINGPTWTAEAFRKIRIELIGSIDNGSASASNMNINFNADMGGNYAHSLAKTSTTDFYSSGGVGDNNFAAVAGYNNSSQGAFICNIEIGAKTNGFARVGISEATHMRNTVAAGNTISRGGFSWQNTATPFTTFILSFESGAEFTGNLRVVGVR